MLARGAPVASKKERGPSLAVESRVVPNLEVMMGLDLMVILKKQ